MYILKHLKEKHWSVKSTNLGITDLKDFITMSLLSLRLSDHLVSDEHL